MRILVADDEYELAAGLEAMLKREHYSVDVVHDGQEAFDWAYTDNYDCIVLDIMMPKKDGLTVLKELRSRGISTPVLLLTAKGEADDRIKGLNEGADDYLPKPFVMGEFLARVKALTRRGTAYVPTATQVGDVSLDRDSFELSCGENSVRLGNKEFQMLDMMLRQQGRFVSTEQFIERIWGYDSYVENNVVWTYISYLRRKLESIGSQGKIVSSRGRGYTVEFPS